jgi:hypothetical protein
MNSLRGVVVARTSMATVCLRLVPLYTGEVANADPTSPHAVDSGVKKLLFFTGTSLVLACEIGAFRE